MDKETLLKEREEKLKIEEEKRIKKEKQKAEMAEKQALKDAQRKINPVDMFKHEVDKYSQWDDLVILHIYSITYRISLI